MVSESLRIDGIMLLQDDNATKETLSSGHSRGVTGQVVPSRKARETAGWAASLP
jgi:hypothetical protein